MPSFIIRECKKNAAAKNSIIIRQVDSKKASRAEQVKRQNFDQKVLFGAKSEKKENESVNPTDKHGIQSEIFWTLQHDADVKEVMNKKNLTLKKKKVVSDDSTIKPVDVFEKTPEAFARFRFDVPKPVRVIRDALDELDSHINPQLIDKLDQKEIPFSSNQLKDMISFPWVVSSNDLIIDSFSNTMTSQKTFQPTPSVSKILQATMSPSQKNALIQWKSLKIAELGLEGFEEMQQSHLNRGKKFHECVQKYFDGIEMSDEEIPIDMKEIWQSITPVLGDFEKPALITEQYISHPYLHYKGVVDCVSSYNNSIIVIEWKNSERLKKTISSTYDAPLQLCAYLAALNSTEFMHKEPIRKGAVVVAYNDGQPADLFILSEKDINRYWKHWLSRLQEYWTRYRDNTLTDAII